MSKTDKCSIIIEKAANDENVKGTDSEISSVTKFDVGMGKKEKLITDK